MIPDGKINLIGMNREEMESFVQTLNTKGFHGTQLFRWVYQRGADRLDWMTDISLNFREKLKIHASLNRPKTLRKNISKIDGTIKLLIGLEDGLKIESVLIPSQKNNQTIKKMKRMTLCLSTQVGCPLDCKFCATGTMGYYRNLTSGEIVGQVLEARSISPIRISNIVFMGMGEPLLNYNNVMKAIDIISDDEAIGISPRRITISTVGYVNKIKKMADEGRKVKLAISLHSLDDRFRSDIMPINNRYNIADLLAAARYYYDKTRERVTFEYIYFEGLNDRDKDVKALKKLSGIIPCKLNIIPYHPISPSSDSGTMSLFNTPTPDALNEFVDRLRNECDFPVMLRSSSGIDIDGACGQLVVNHDEG